jgi:large conductance mechanosensitive channel
MAKDAKETKDKDTRHVGKALERLEELEIETQQSVKNIEQKVVKEAGIARQMVKGQLGGFLSFVREQGVVGLAVGVVIGVAVKDTVDRIVAGLITPLIEIFLPSGEALEQARFRLFGSEFLYGSIISSLINLLAVAAVIYFVLKGIGLDKLDKKKGQ